MEEIEKVVKEIVAGCEERGVPCPAVLAAFMARTVVDNDGRRFMLDRPVTSSDLSDVVERSIQRLLQQNDPGVETIKMQVAFNSSLHIEDGALDEGERSRAVKLQDLSRRIVGVASRSGEDHGSLSALYKEIFDFLMAHCDAPDSTADVRRVEREVAAALESVFPRIGLRSFLQLSPPQRGDQLSELASIVMGIRLFNKQSGKGGADIEMLDDGAVTSAAEARADLSAEADKMSDLCALYEDALAAAFTGRSEASERELARWKAELAHRRQYLSFLRALLEDVSAGAEKAAALHAHLSEELSSLDSMVGGRGSVPKEHVYPKFEAIAQLHNALRREVAVLRARLRTLGVLRALRDSFDETLRPAPPNERDAPLDAAAADPAAPDGGGGAVEGGGDGGERPVVLGLRSAPEVMQLPLEYEGFCAWTAVSRDGLLLPGKPELGVVRWRGASYVFAQERALRDFLEAPLRFLDGMRDLCAARPELIHLLRVQDHFPKTSIAAMLRGGEPRAASGAAAGAGAPPPPPRMVDASTETPVHFVERNVDVNYSWNEWELRRRALRVANLRKCATSSQQTEESTFRRENVSQVYLPRHQSTMTRRDAGTNPKVTVSYLQGLRGRAREAAQPALVRMTYELGGGS